MWSLSGKALRGVFRLNETTEMRPVFGRGLADPVRHTALCRRRGRYRGLYVETGHRDVRVRFQNVFWAPLAQAGSRGTFARSGIAARGGVARGIGLRRSDLVRANLNQWIPVAVRLACLVCLVRGAAFLRARGDGFQGGFVTAEVDYIHPNRKMPMTIREAPRPDHSVRRRPIRKGDSRL